MKTVDSGEFFHVNAEQFNSFAEYKIFPAEKFDTFESAKSPLETGSFSEHFNDGNATKTNSGAQAESNGSELRRQIEKANRAKTVVTLLDGIIKYGAAIALIFLVLQACGVNTAAIWESVGILTLIVGLGAQSLIADIIAGVFIIFEDEYSVGEIVSIDDFRGTVSEIGIRATKVLDMAGNIKIINNSDIKNVVNLSRELSLAVVDCEFSYDVPLEFVETLFKEHLDEFAQKIPAIVEGPYYKGVSGYGSSNVAIKLMAKCAEEDRYQVQRDLLREYRQLFVANGIDLSYDQVVINQPSQSNIEVSRKQKKEAERFVEEQKLASEGLEDQPRD